MFFSGYSLLEKLKLEDGNEGCKKLCFSISFLIWGCCRKLHKPVSLLAVPSTMILLSRK